MSMTGEPSRASTSLYAKAALRVNLQHRYSVQTDGIWPVGRAGCKDSGERRKRFIAGVDLQAGAICQMQPGQYDDLRSRQHSVSRVDKWRGELQPCFGCAF